MNLESALQGLTHFFNDFIGAVVPGFVLLLGLVVMYKGLIPKPELLLPVSNDYMILAILALSFATGHALLAIYKDIIEINLVKIKYEEFALFGLKFKNFKLIDSSKDHVLSIEATKPYLLFKLLFENNMSKGLGDQFKSNIYDWSFHDLRSIAMSVSSEAASLGQRFMFISLLCNGVGTALILLWINFFACIIFAPHLLNNYSYAFQPFTQLSILALSATLVIRRGNEFHRRALSVPFCVVNSGFLKQDKINGTIT